ncbi:MAG TPA: HAD-IA family hydrolase [Trichocoleus sp.]
MLKALLFDLDGTIVSTDPLHLSVWRELLQPYGYTVDKGFYQARISGRLNADIVLDLLPQLGAEGEPEFSAAKEARFRELAADGLTPMAGLLPMLQWGQQQGLAMAVVTNAPRANAEFMLQTMALEHYFNPVVLAGELPLGKPDPLPYQEALHLLNLKPDEALAFEDSISGVRSAVGAGLVTIGIASTHTPAVLHEAGATLVVPDFTAEDLLQFGLMASA